EGLLVEALHDGKDVAFRLTWEDATKNDSQVKPQEFTDGVAIEWALGAGEPIVAMGDAESPVGLWYWRAAWGADRAAPRDVESAYPGMAVDRYPSLKKPSLGGVMPDIAADAPASAFDPTFLTGLGAKNLLSNLSRGMSIEVATAGGIGTLKTAP